MSIRKAEPADIDRIADLVAHTASGPLPNTRAAIAAEIGRDIGASNGQLEWILADTPGGPTVARIAIIPPPPIYDLKGGLAGIVLDVWTAPGASSDLRPFEQHLRDRGAAMLVVSCDATDAALRKPLDALGYTATTHFMLKPVLESAAPSPDIRTATEADIPALVAFNREARERLHDANPVFWTSHPEAESRFALWMKFSLTMRDRTLLIAEQGSQPSGFVIAQPASPIQVPIALDETKIGVIDDFHGTAFGVSLKAAQDASAQNLLNAAEADFLKRGKSAAMAICPVAWIAKARLLEEAGYRIHHTWFVRPAVTIL